MKRVLRIALTCFIVILVVIGLLAASFPGKKRSSSNGVMGYGMQWWIPDADGDYTAIGVFNQFIYVNPALQLVIAENSANHRYGTGGSDEDREYENIALFKAVEEELRSAN